MMTLFGALRETVGCVAAPAPRRGSAAGVLRLGERISPGSLATPVAAGLLSAALRSGGAPTAPPT